MLNSFCGDFPVSTVHATSYCQRYLHWLHLAAEIIDCDFCFQEDEFWLKIVAIVIATFIKLATAIVIEAAIAITKATAAAAVAIDAIVMAIAAIEASFATTTAKLTAIYSRLKSVAEGCYFGRTFLQFEHNQIKRADAILIPSILII